MDDLVDAAREARRAAYAPYSEFPVGAAVRAPDGTVYTGANVEIANFSNSLHAEEVAVGKAVSDGVRAIERVAVSGGSVDGLTPCGACRQTLAEFGDDATPVLCDEGEGAEPTVYDLGTLLPDTIGPADLGVEP